MLIEVSCWLAGSVSRAVWIVMQANTQYVENEIEKLNGDQLVELKV